MAELELGSRLNKVPDGSINETQRADGDGARRPSGAWRMRNSGSGFNTVLFDDIDNNLCCVCVGHAFIAKYDLACTVGTTIRSKVIAKELNISCKHLYIILFLGDVHANRP
jgi:hypothetical protein